jgi:hypothetical protein
VSISDEGQKKLSTEFGIAMHNNVASSQAQESNKIDKLKEEIKE